jgi:hypothetical protein
MIFKVNEAEQSIDAVSSSWNPKELEVEKFLLSGLDEEEPILESSVFGEAFLIVRNQVQTIHGKRADILAVDKAGNAVIIELKRNQGTLGVETQALQYLAELSVYKGGDFVKYFSRYSDNLEENLQGFLGDDIQIEDINRQSRIILVARSFDTALFSMGEWLSQKGVAFRCIQYEPIEISGERFINFSVAFDRTPEYLYPLSFQIRSREPDFFWHNIGRANNDWWSYLVRANQICASFDNKPGDPGEQILKSYIAGDVIVAYAKGYGAVGWGEITDPNSYKLLKPNSPGDKLNGKYLHRLSISWKATAAKLKDGIEPKILREKFDLFHPLSTSVRMDRKKAQTLVDELSKKYS